MELEKPNECRSRGSAQWAGQWDLILQVTNLRRAWNDDDVPTAIQAPFTRIRPARPHTNRTCDSSFAGANRSSNMQDFGGSHHDGPARGQKRSNSQTRHSRPTTPLRPSSRSSFRDSARDAGKDAPSFPLNTFEPAFAELSDAMADLEANMMHFQLMHESLSRFSESFASFLYGMNMNAFCVDFPEVKSFYFSFCFNRSNYSSNSIAQRRALSPSLLGEFEDQKRHVRPRMGLAPRLKRLSCESLSCQTGHPIHHSRLVTLNTTLGLPIPHLSTIHRRPQRLEQSLHLLQIDNPASRLPEGHRPQEQQIDEPEVEGADYWAVGDELPYEERVKRWFFSSRILLSTIVRKIYDINRWGCRDTDKRRWAIMATDFFI